MDEQSVSQPASEIATATLDGTTAPGEIGHQTGALLDMLNVGGPVLWILGILSVVTLALILAKAVQFFIARTGSRSPRAGLGFVVQSTNAAIEQFNADRSFAEDAGRRAARQIMRPLEGGLGTLGMIAMLSPLIGLLGTVIGMIGAFHALEASTGMVDPSVLSGGIWVALLTTAAGLVVAIPATLAHGWFEARLARFADEAESKIGEAIANAAPAHNQFRVAAE